MRPFLAAFAIAATPVLSEPLIVTDIAPVHSLVSAVMGDLGQPTLLLEAAADPHHATLRPSQASALAKADGLFWIGPALTPWLARATLGKDAHAVALSEIPGTNVIHLNDGHHAIDPHTWLAPENAILWLATIAKALGHIDPPNAEQYAENANAMKERLQALSAELAAQLVPFAEVRYLVAHDAYAYFGQSFGLNLTEAISDSDAAAPSAARIAELRESMNVAPFACAFLEPQQSPAALETVLAGTNTPQAELDPLGTELDSGVALYPDLLRAMANGIASCAD